MRLYTNAQMHKYTNSQIHKYKNSQIHKYQCICQNLGRCWKSASSALHCALWAGYRGTGSSEWLWLAPFALHQHLYLRAKLTVASSSHFHQKIRPLSVPFLFRTSQSSWLDYQNIQTYPGHNFIFLLQRFWLAHGKLLCGLICAYVFGLRAQKGWVRHICVVDN